MNNVSLGYTKAVGLSLLFYFLGLIINIVLPGAGFFFTVDAIEPVLGVLFGNGFARIVYLLAVVVTFVLLGRYIARFLKTRYRTELFGVIWMTSVFSGLIVIHTYTVSDLTVLLFHWLLFFTFILIIVCASVYVYLSRNTFRHMHKGVALRTGMFVVVVLPLVPVILFPDFMVSGGMDRGVDLAIKGSLSVTRSQAEMYYNHNNYSYLGVCADEVMQRLFSAVEENGGKPFCVDSDLQWAAESVFAKREGYWCVDSRGGPERYETSSISSSDFLCGPEISVADPSVFQEVIGLEKEQLLQAVAVQIYQSLSPEGQMQHTVQYRYDVEDDMYVFNNDQRSIYPGAYVGIGDRRVGFREGGKVFVSDL